MVAGIRPQWVYLHHENQQILHVRVSFPGEKMVKHFSALRSLTPETCYGW